MRELIKQCKECPNRNPGCQSRCETGQKITQHYKNKRESIREKKLGESLAYGVKMDAVYTPCRHRGRRKR